MKSGDWNWLEVAKLCVTGLTPLALAFVGVYIHRVSKRFEHQQWRNQKLIEKRIAIYDDIAADLNSILCYFTYVGDWKDVTPPEMVSAKRVVDRKIHLARPLFEPSFFVACQQFQEVCFSTFNGPGQDAKLRTHLERRRRVMNSIPGKEWDDRWNYSFIDPPAEPEEVRKAYSVVMEEFSKSLEISAYLGTAVR